MKKPISSWHVGIAAEAFAAGLFARCGFDVSVQYGANQPEYDLIIVREDKMMKVSVKGSQDGAWGLTQSYKEKNTYHEAIDIWLKKHHKHTVFCFVQFKDVKVNELTCVYLAAPFEISERLRSSANGRGETILFEYHEWGKSAKAYGSIDKIPKTWEFSLNRIEELFKQISE